MSRLEANRVDVCVLVVFMKAETCVCVCVLQLQDSEEV